MSDDPANLDQLANRVTIARAEAENRLERQRIQQARHSLGKFLEYVIRDSSTTKPIKLAAIHREWEKHIIRNLRPGRRIGMMAPWGFGKSVFTAIGFVLWLLGLDQRLRIGLISNSDDNAVKRLKSCGEYILESEAYHRVFPEVRPDQKKGWNDHRLTLVRDTVANEGSLEAHGIDSRGTGSRYDVLIFDDPVDEDDRKSAATRKSRVEKALYTWLPRLEPNGNAILIATRWARDDIPGVLLETPGWNFLVQGVSQDLEYIDQPPLEYTSYDNVVDAKAPRRIPPWNEKWPKAALERDLAEKGSAVFTLGRRMIPIDVSERLFDFKKFWECIKWDAAPEDVVADEWSRYTGVDLAGDKRPGTVLFTHAVTPKRQKIVTEIRRGDWGFGPKTADQIASVHETQKPSIIMIENNFSQQIMLALVRERHGQNMPLKGFWTGKLKADPLEGLPGLATQIENDVWIFPFKHIRDHRKIWTRCKCPYCAFIRELHDFPHGAETDTLMAMWFSDRAGSKGRPSHMPTIVRAGEQRVFAAAENETRVFQDAGSSKRVFSGTPFTGGS